MKEELENTSDEKSNAVDEEFISQEDLQTIKDVTQKRNTATQSLAQLEKAALEAKVANLEYQVRVQHMYIKYSLGFEDSIHDQTGKIVRKGKI